MTEIVAFFAKKLLELLIFNAQIILFCGVQKYANLLYNGGYISEIDVGFSLTQHI